MDPMERMMVEKIQRGPKREWAEMRSSDVGKAILEALAVSYMRDLMRSSIQRISHYIYQRDLSHRADLDGFQVPDGKVIKIQITLVDEDDI